MRVQLSDVSLWFDVSGPSVIPDGAAVIERPTVVAVHGGPGADHINLKDALAPLAEHFQIVFYDQRGHGRSDRSSPRLWTQRTWATDLKELCDVLGLDSPVVLGSSFGGRVVLTYAGLFPGHASGIILANASGGRSDDQRSVEIFRRLGGDDAAAAAERDFTENSEESRTEFRRLCGPLYSTKPWSAEELHQQRARSIQTMDVNVHFFRDEASQFSPWNLLDRVASQVLVLAGEDDPVCPLPVVEELASRLPAETTSLVRLPGARHAIFRDRPDLAFPAIEEFVHRVAKPGVGLPNLSPA
jgi:pimeloyl-ACP methyl ester carboxylesterase